MTQAEKYRKTHGYRDCTYILDLACTEMIALLRSSHPEKRLEEVAPLSDQDGMKNITAIIPTKDGISLEQRTWLAVKWLHENIPAQSERIIVFGRSPISTHSLGGCITSREWKISITYTAPATLEMRFKEIPV